ncbi:MAG: ion channel [Chthoniobacterales bacterium]
MGKTRNDWRHLALLISILFLFVVTPMVAVLRFGVLIVNAIAALVLIAASYSLSARRRLFVAGMVLSGISALATVTLLLTGKLWAAIFAHSCAIVLIAYFTITILGDVLGGTRVTMDKIFAAICVYLLIGYGWTFAYALIDDVQQGSFIAQSTTPPNDYDRILEMRYFSFMTLTTVGYGDIVPHSSTARTVTALEAVTGQIYLTVLVARLVGLHIVHAHGSRKRED